MTMSLNRRGLWVVEALAHADERRVAVHPIEGGGRYVDCGIEARGGLARGHRAGAGLPGRPGAGLDRPGRGRGPGRVRCSGRHRSSGAACLASQYAGWAIKEGKFFAMGSGPMRAAAGTRGRSST